MTVELDKVQKFITRTKEGLKSYKASGDLRVEIEKVIKELEGHDLKVNNPVPTVLPVCRYLEEAYRYSAPRGPVASIVGSLKQIMPDLTWQHGYNDPEMRGELASNFGVADVIGPYGLVFSSRFKLGVVLLGPQTWYPPHAHPSIELYYILSGEAEWHTGDNRSIESAGSMIFHHSNQPHAMLTGKTPFLAVYTWRGDIRTGSKFL